MSTKLNCVPPLVGEVGSDGSENELTAPLVEGTTNRTKLAPLRATTPASCWTKSDGSFEISGLGFGERTGCLPTPRSSRHHMNFCRHILATRATYDCRSAPDRNRTTRRGQCNWSAGRITQSARGKFIILPDIVSVELQDDERWRERTHDFVPLYAIKYWAMAPRAEILEPTGSRLLEAGDEAISTQRLNAFGERVPHEGNTAFW